MNPLLLNQRLLENAALMRLYQDYTVPNTFATQALSSSIVAYQSMFLKARAMKMMQLKNLQYLNTYNDIKAVHFPMVKLETSAPAPMYYEHKVQSYEQQVQPEVSPLHFPQELKLTKIESEPTS